MMNRPTPLMVTDPVCGMEFDADRAAATLYFNGQQYYFCHPACLRLFQTDPLQYLADVQGDGETGATVEAT